MPKLKTKKAVSKRFKVSGTGKIIHKRTNRSHRAFGKTTKQKRHLRKEVVLNPVSADLIGRALPYRKMKGKRK
ncbi:MAG: 50S ribosomal protein L35 [Mycoplasmataceae bacterium]|jgi:large subunit ribosomal protein L35|nr:50S ribosomal protein L35 [Mycoplasmataceae bacterium]